MLGSYCFLVKLPVSTSVRMSSLTRRGEGIGQGPGGVLLDPKCGRQRLDGRVVTASASPGGGFRAGQAGAMTWVMAP